MAYPVMMREMPAWIVDGMEILEKKAAFLNMVCLAMSLLDVDKVEEISTPDSWKGLSWYTMELVDELGKMKKAAKAKKWDD